jgi:hypothetical protein
MKRGSQLHPVPSFVLRSSDSPFWHAHEVPAFFTSLRPAVRAAPRGMACDPASTPASIIAWVSSLVGSPRFRLRDYPARQCCERRAPCARRGREGASCSGAMIEQVRPRAAYDTIGRGYGSVRRPDPRSADAIWGAPEESSSVINVGVGSGSHRLRWISSNVGGDAPSSYRLVLVRVTESRRPALTCSSMAKSS